MRAKFVVTKKDRKTKNNARVIFHAYAATPRFEFWYAGNHRRLNHPRQISCQSVQVFGGSDPRNFAIFIGLAGATL